MLQGSHIQILTGLGITEFSEAVVVVNGGSFFFLRGGGAGGWGASLLRYTQLVIINYDVG